AFRKKVRAWTVSGAYLSLRRSCPRTFPPHGPEIADSIGAGLVDIAARKQMIRRGGQRRRPSREKIENRPLRERAHYTKNSENSYCPETGNPCSLALMPTSRKP